MGLKSRRAAATASATAPRGVREPDEVRSALSGLHRLIYTSEAREPGTGSDGAVTDADVVASASSHRNSALGLSGVLVAVQGHFVQILEGPSSDLEMVFEKICRDMRHRAVQLIDFAPATHRQFEAWGMVALDARRAADAEPYEDLFASIIGGMAPAAIVSDVRQFLDEHLSTSRSAGAG